MKTITRNGSNASIFVFEDSDIITVSTDNITCPNLTIADMNSDNATVHTNVTIPEDWKSGKYLFDGTNWSVNENWTDPEERAAQRKAELAAQYKAELV